MGVEPVDECGEMACAAPIALVPLGDVTRAPMLSPPGVGVCAVVEHAGGIGDSSRNSGLQRPALDSCSRAAKHSSPCSTPVVVVVECVGAGGGGGVSGLPRKLGNTEAGRGGGGCGDGGDETDEVDEVRAARLARCRDNIGLESSERNGDEDVVLSAALSGRRPPPCGGGELEVILATVGRWLIYDHCVFILVSVAPV